MFQQFQMIPRDRGVPSYPGFTSFLFLSFFLFLSLPSFTRSVIVDTSVLRYSKHNVIADIGWRRSRYTHLFSSCSRRAFPPRLAACLRPNGNLHASQILFRRRPLSFTISFPHYSARSVVRSFVRSFVFRPFLRHCPSVRLYTRASMLRNANTQGTKPRERMNERARPCTHGKFGASPTKTPKN